MNDLKGNCDGPDKGLKCNWQEYLVEILDDLERIFDEIETTFF